MATGRTHQWRGVIEEYRDRLPVGAATPVITLREGGTPLVPAPTLSERHRLRGVPEGRGREPDRVVQGPRHDDGDLEGGRGRGAQAVICASTGNTSASAAAYAVRGGMVCAVLVPAGQDRARQDVAGARARGRAAAGRRGTSTTASAWPASWPSTTRSRWSTASTRTGSRGRRPRRSRSSTRSATRPTSTACRSATPATSPPTGGATASTPPTARRPGGPGCGASRRPARRRSSAAQPVARPSTIATAIRIGNPASWRFADRGPRRVRRSHRGGHRPADPAGVPAAGSPGGRLRRAGLRRVGGRAAPGARGGPARRRARRVVCTVTGHGLKDPQWAIDGAPAPSDRSRRRARGRRSCSAWTADGRGRCSAPPRSRVRVPATAPTSGPASTPSGWLWRSTTTSSCRSPSPGSTSRSPARGPTRCRRRERHLVVKAMRAAFEVLGGQPRGPRAAVRQPDPARARPGVSAPRRSSPESSRPGRWSSAAPTGWTTWPCCGSPSSMEGHPDNVAACSARRLHRRLDRSPAGYAAVSSRVPDGVVPVVLVPTTAVVHGQGPPDAPRVGPARGRRPSTPAGPPCSSHALTTRPDLLLAGHRGPAAPAVPAPRPCRASAALVDRLRAAGLPAVISGAGPTVLVLASPRHGREGRGGRAQRLGGARAGYRLRWGQHPADGVGELLPSGRSAGSAGHDRATHPAGGRDRLAEVLLCASHQAPDGPVLHRTPSVRQPVPGIPGWSSDVRARHRSTWVHVSIPLP